MTSKLPIVLAFGLATATLARAEAPASIDLAQLATVVAGQEIRIEAKATGTIVTTAREESFVVDEPAISVAEQICGDDRRDYDLGQGQILLCTARTLD